MDESETVDIGAGPLWSGRQAADLLSVTTKPACRHIQDEMVGSVRVGPRLLHIRTQNLRPS
jgi:hypothetical protein